jgi:sugar (pentulose or hexulose) kinase
VLSGVAASEASALGAQSQLWNVARGDWSPIVAARDWGRLLPPLRPAWDDLGPVRPALAARHGLPEGLRVHLGGHDSSLNLYRYQAAGLTDFTLVSTGTWIVAMRPGHDPARLDEARNMVLNADVFARPVGGALTMGGREFEAIAGGTGGRPVRRQEVAAVAAAGTVAVPTFGHDSGQFPGSAGKGRIVGALPAGLDPERARRALALMHVAMLTVACAECLSREGALILDGTFLKEPQFATLVAALSPGHAVLASAETAGVPAGAALLAGHAERGGAPVAVGLEPVAPARVAGLAVWAAIWRSHAKASGRDGTE